MNYPKLENGKAPSRRIVTGAEQEVFRYLRIIRKRKTVIAITAFVVLAIWLGFIVAFQATPVYESSVILTFQDTKNTSVAEGGRKKDVNWSRASLVLTHSLLSKVVEKLQLNFSMITDNVDQDEVFRYLKVSKEAKTGYYRLVHEGGEFQIYYSKDDDDNPGELLKRFAASDTIDVNQLLLAVNPGFFEQHNIHELRWQVRDVNEAVDKLRNKINYMLDKSRTILTITVSHKNPKRAAQIANTLAELFVDMNLHLRRRQSDEVVSILQNQLRVAKADLDAANERLRRFRERNPWVTLSKGDNAQINVVSSLQLTKNQIEQTLNDLQALVERAAQAADPAVKFSTARELVTYLTDMKVALAPAFEKEYNDLVVKRNTLLQQYAPTHPFVVQVEKDFESFRSKLLQAAQDQLNVLRQRLASTQQQIEESKKKLQRLPQKELELAELVRDQEVKNDIYLKILSRLNAAKIENQVEVSDVFIVDYATPPTPKDPLSDLIKKGLFGVLIALGAGLGMGVVVDFFDKTVKDVEDLNQKVQYPVLGQIPVIQVVEPDEKNLEESRGKIDPKLITLDYSPTLESESYRDLRTKILFRNKNQNLHSFLVTSLQPNEGKSLLTSNLAITIAQQKISTLLIDGDLRRGVQHSTFGNKKKPGLSDFLVSRATIDYDNVSKVIHPTFIPNLFLIPAGSPIPNPTEVIGSTRMQDLLQLLGTKFGMIVLDTPPISASSDVAILANLVDGALIVVRAGYTNVEELVGRLHEYPSVEEKIMGLVLNMVKVDRKKNQYTYSYYNY